MVNPAPSIALDGQFYSCATTTDSEGRTVLYADRATVVGRLTVDWGRADQWTQPDPSVLTFTLWEPASLTTTWLKKIVNGTSLRRGCWLTYNKPNFTNATYPGDKWIFRGFTTNVDVQAETRRTTLGLTPGWLVQIQCSDSTAFIGQEEWNSGTLPRETMQQRAVRIKNMQLYSAGCREIYFEDRFKDGYVNPLDVTGQSVIDTMAAMYASFADQWTFNPDRNVVIRIPGGANFSTFALRFGHASAGTPDTDPNVIRLYPPRWIDSTGQQDPIDQRPYPAASVGACDVSGPVALSSTALNDITDIACSWHDAITNAPTGVDYTSKLNVKNSLPRNTLHFDSWYENGTDIDPILQDVKDTVQKDGARPCHPEIRWNTKQRPIPDWQTFESITLSAQTIRMLVLTGSPFSAALGYSPVWHPCGGVIAYENGHWDITLNLSPSTMPPPAGFTPVTCATINQSITLGDPNNWHLDPSITPYDLQYVNNSDAGVYGFN